MDSFQARRVTKDHTRKISASPADIFPLLCPVREYDWIDGWTCRMIHSDSGVAENNCIFKTSFPRGAEETWVVSHYDPDRYIIQFVVFNPEAYVMKLDFSLQSCGVNITLVSVRNTFTGLSEKGNAFVANYTDGTNASAVSRLFEALEHYCTTGKMLKRKSVLGAVHAALHRM